MSRVDPGNPNAATDGLATDRSLERDGDFPVTADQPLTGCDMPDAPADGPSIAMQNVPSVPAHQRLPDGTVDPEAH